jgi:hypothetical protein
MRIPTGFAALASTVALLGAGAAAAAPMLEIRQAVARVTIIPEDRTDIVAVVARPNAKFPLSVARAGDQTVVTGNLGGRSANCNGWFGRHEVTVPGLGTVGYDDMPQVVVHTPRQVIVKAGGAVFGVIDRGAGVTLANAGCGDWVVASQSGPLRVSLAGSGDLRAGDAAATDIALSGSSDVVMRGAHGGLNVRVSGSGDVSAEAVEGPLHASITGSGDVKVRGGAVSEMKVVVAGSGDIRFGGVAQSLDATVAGSGDVSAARVTGLVVKHIAGSGDVTVGR